MSMARQLKGLTKSDKSHDQFILWNKIKLLLLAVVLVGIWIVTSSSVMTKEEELVWDRVHAAQQYLSQWRQDNGTAPEVEADPWNTGLIGVEWSGLTTTLGALEAKRTACNPAWTIQYRRWFTQLGLEAGDPVAIFSSSSFPGLLLSAVVAAEASDLDISLIVSLGSSTWGANHPESPWPLMASELRRKGFIHTRADYYTLGGGGEMGRSLFPEGDTLLRKAASDAGVKLLSADNLDKMTALKFDLLKQHGSKLLVSIGGSHANMGDDEDVLTLPPGLIPASSSIEGGSGLIGVALNNHIPVIHMLNMKRLSAQVGIPFDSEPRKYAPEQFSLFWSAVGLCFFLFVLWRYRRWKLVDDKV
jgi:poly-gamma-glutamate system protein